ncbi:MAG: glycosyltransferase family 4 protein [Methanophagales archaeon]|nr:glycosyltransferase family 4 protein [Methanophagales archaeon]
MNRKIRILFVRPLKSSFIQEDLKLLRKHFNVRVVDFVLSIRKKPKETLKTMFNMLTGVLWADITFSWFAGYHAYWAVRLSKIFRKKSVAIVGGYEVAKVPEIGYGALLNPRSTRIVKYVLENADRVLTVDNSLKKDAIKNLSVAGKNIQTVPTGYDYEKFKPEGEKENLVLTVSVGDSWERIRLKGLDTFVKSAEFLSDVRFLVIGIQGGALKKLQDFASPNVEFLGSLLQDELIPYYQRAKVYCQLSMREGLPNAVCETMLCECVPVGTDVQGVRTAIGDAGFYVPYGDVEATVEAIKKALKSDNGKAARERIQKMFPIERREKELLRIIANEITKSG